MRKEFRIGLCGLGAMGKAHAFSVDNLKYYYGVLPFGASIKGVCTTTEEKSRAVAEQYGFELATADEDALINDPSLDIIDIRTPNIYHYDTVRKALSKGKHVYCEKPLCVSAAQAKELAELAKQSGKICTVVFNNRHLAPIMRAAELIRENRLGQILSFFAGYLHNSCTDVNRKKFQFINLSL